MLRKLISVSKGPPSDHLPDNKVHVPNMGSTWGQQDPGGPHVGHMNLAIRATLNYNFGAHAWVT